MSKPKAIASGKLFDTLDCYVLDDGRRVVSQRGIVRALTTGPDGSGRDRGDLGTYLARLPSRFGHLAAAAEVAFDSPTGPAFGRDAAFVTDLLAAYDDADDAGELHPSQAHLARNSRRLLRAIAKVGMVALIDEATGYERIREAGQLSWILRETLREDTADWERMWPRHVVNAVGRLSGYQWTAGRFPVWFRGHVGRINRMLFGPEVIAEVRRRNPKPRRGSNDHQLLQDAPRAKQHEALELVAILAKQSASMDEFWARMAAHFLGAPMQTRFW